jgi:hypothetical protein
MFLPWPLQLLPLVFRVNFIGQRWPPAADNNIQAIRFPTQHMVASNCEGVIFCIFEFGDDKCLGSRCSAQVTPQEMAPKCFKEKMLALFNQRC